MATNNKEYMREYHKRYMLDPINRERHRLAKMKYRSSAHGRAKQKEYDQRDYVLARKRITSARFSKSPAGREYYRKKQAEWRKTPFGREYERAGRKAYKQHRRARCLDTDVTIKWLKQLIESATLCPLCGEYFSKEYSDPHSKTVDHIIPLGVGGKHIKANLRIVCRQCNITRPKDGRDENKDGIREDGVSS